MSTSTNTPRGARRAQTYFPEADARDELLDFAQLMRELEAHLVQDSSKAALVDPQGAARPIPDEIFRILDQVTNALAAGEGLTIIPQGMTVTTQQAADFLGISSPTLPLTKSGRQVALLQAVVQGDESATVVLPHTAPYAEHVGEQLRREHGVRCARRAPEPGGRAIQRTLNPRATGRVGLRRATSPLGWGRRRSGPGRVRRDRRGL